MAGIFTISLDYELHWGVFDKRDREARKTCYEHTIKLVPQLLQAFEAYKVQVTWATVGAMFAEDEASFWQYAPEKKPAYLQEKFNAYHWVKENGIQQKDTGAHFAKDSILLIENFEGQELATHTYAHFYCLEPGQTVAEFAADLNAVQAIALDTVGKKMTSLVFPRNQFNDDYLAACYQAGITIIRSNPNTWYWTGIANDETSLQRKIFRTGDTYLPIGNHTYSLNKVVAQNNLPICLPASRLLREYDAKYNFLNVLRLKRVLAEMTYAAKEGKCYHLWWHPENFGTNPTESMKDVMVILQHFKWLKAKYGMVSYNMKEMAKIINKK